MTGHVVVLHRWRAPYAEYERYLDHRGYRVSYVTTPVGAAGVPRGAAAVTLVDATDAIEQVRAAVAGLERRFGPPRAVVALKEDDLLTAARINAERGLPGRTPAELAVFRDKLAMARAVRDAGLDAPYFAEAATPEQVSRFGDRHGWPVVVKPRLGSSSEGVRVFGSAAAVDPAWRPGPDGALMQTWVDGELLHVDGVFDGVRLGPWRASRYLGTPLDFRRGRWAGSVEIDDGPVQDAVGRYTAALLPALTSGPTVFHLELFIRPGPDGAPRCTFVEIGARVGGAEVPFLWREVHGYDLMAEAFRFATGGRGDAGPLRSEPFRFATGGLGNAGPGQASAGGGPLGSFPVRAGMLLVPAPTGRPCEVTAVRPVLGTAAAPPELYAQEVLAVGDVIPDAPAYYEHVGGRFRFRGASASAVAAAIRTVAGAFVIEGRPVRPLDAAPTPAEPAGTDRVAHADRAGRAVR